MLEDFTKAEVQKVSRFWLYVRGGKVCLTRREMIIWNFLDVFAENYNTDLDSFMNYVKGHFVKAKPQFIGELKVKVAQRIKRILKLDAVGVKATYDDIRTSMAMFD